MLTGQQREWQTVPPSDVLTGRLVNVTALTIDVGRAGLSDDPDVANVTISGGPVALTFVRNGAVVRQRTLG